MKETRKLVPKYFTEVKSILSFVLFTAVFGLLFVYIYNPFSWLDKYDIYSLNFFFRSLILVLTGIIALTISRFIMRLYANKHSFYYIQYIIWLLCEIVLLAILYTIFSLIINFDKFPGLYNIIDNFKSAVSYVALIISLPYIISTLYFALQDKSRRLKQIESEKEREEITHPLDSSVIVFRDNNGVFRISITIENIIYLESADNYVAIKYLNKGKLSDFLLRNTLRTLDKQLEGTNIIRCHRSYMVNFEHVKVIRRDKLGVYIELDLEGIDDIPVSKTYNKNVTEHFLKHSSNN
jgi:hypothetical protein